MILFPNCKINLGLRVIRRRSDGYHDIETVMAPVGWHDILEIVPSKSTQTTLVVTGNPVHCEIEKNLVMKAYRGVQKLIPDLPPVDIYLRKIIPDGAGLGGGSSDAAFTIIGLNKLFSLGMNEETMSEIASGIGADCPFFIYDRLMLCQATGTEMNPVELNIGKPAILIVKPPESISTKEAYSGIKPHPAFPSLPVLLSQPINEWRRNVFNDFEKTVFEKCPACGIIKERLYDLGAEFALMSGSGSAVYGFFRNDKLAETAMEMFGGMVIHKCNIL